MRPDEGRHGARWPCLAAICVVALPWLGCGADPSRETRPVETAGGPNLLFIVSDTLRADAIDCDLHRERTPNLCELGERGTVFEKAYAGGPWTLPSSVALFTGNHATAYAQERPGSAANWSERDEFFQIADAHVLLADALVQRGYEALRFNEGMLPGEANAYQGLTRPTIKRREAIEDQQRLYPEASDWGRKGFPLQDLGVLQYLLTRDKQPFFLLLWIMNPHAPYSPPQADQQHLAEAVGPLPHPASFYAELGHLDKPENGHRLLRQYAPYTPEEVEMLVGLYHAEVRMVDQRIGRFLELLRRRGIEDETIVVVTSDHGEGFGEHELYLHGNSFYEELLHIPLLMAGPGIPSGMRVTSRVPNIDVMPTLCDLMGADCLADAEGRSLRPLLSGDTVEEGRLIYSTAPMRQGLRDTLIEGDYKLIIHKHGIELYDLSQDPEERMDLASERPLVVRAMKAKLVELRRRNEERRRENQALLTETDSEQTIEGTLEQMRALGYVE